tara:strand:- start:426 stop:647 length:222 start_codon:yes stop_codon:yes gene_type:complete
VLNQAMKNIKTIKKGFTFLTIPEKAKAKSNPKTIEKPIINASNKLKLNFILFTFHFFMMNISLKIFRFVQMLK